MLSSELDGAIFFSYVLLATEHAGSSLLISFVRCQLLLDLDRGREADGPLWARTGYSHPRAFLGNYFYVLLFCRLGISIVTVVATFIGLPSAGYRD